MRQVIVLPRSRVGLSDDMAHPAISYDCYFHLIEFLNQKPKGHIVHIYVKTLRPYERLPPHVDENITST